MGRPERPLDPDAGPVEEFAAALRDLRNSAGRPTYRVLSEHCGLSATALTMAARGDRLPTLKVALAFAEACGGDRAEWERRWRAAEHAAASIGGNACSVPEPGSGTPYLGLAAYEQEDADRFFGRDELVADVVQRLGDARIAAVAGPSGSGKSSLLRAGVIPAVLRAKRPPWTAVLMTPGADPTAALASALDGAAPRPGPGANGGDLTAWARESGSLAEGGELLLVVDQFEEVFTLCADPRKRAAFIDVLLTSRAPGSRVRVALGLRADYFGHCAGHRRLAAVLGTATVLVGPLSAAELREVIVKPAALARAMVEPALVATIIAEAGGEPGALPLVSHVLRETWRRRRGRTLTLHGYRSTGGIHGAIAQSAETAWATLSPRERRTARQIMLRLIAIDAHGQATQRPAPYGELPGDNVGHVLDVLAGARLITMAKDEVRLAHEALISAWPRLREWLDRDRAGLRIHQQITDTTRTWLSLHRDPDVLLRGSQLAAAREWAGRDRNFDTLTDDEQAFLAAATALEQAARDTTRRRARRFRTLSAALVALAAIVVVTGGVAVRQRQLALARQEQTRSQDMAGRARLVEASNPGEAVRLATSAYRMASTGEARDSLLSVAATARPNDGPLRQGSEDIDAIAVSPDGFLLAIAGSMSGDLVERVEIWNTLRRVRVAVLDQEWATGMAFSPDGRRLIVAGSADDDVHATASVWDLPARRRVVTAVLPARWPVAVAFSAAGRPFAATAGPGVPAGEPPRPRRAWDVSSSVPVPVAGRIPTAFDGYDGYGGKQRYRVRTVRREEDGRPVPVAVTDSRTGRRLWALDETKAQDITAWLLSRDGRVLYLADDFADRIVVWDLTRGTRRAVLRSSMEPVDRMLLSHDGRLLITTTTLPTNVEIYDQTRLPSIGHTGAIDGLAYSPDGRTLASVSGADPRVVLRDAATGAVSGTLPIARARSAPGHAVAYSPRTGMLAVSGTPARSWYPAASAPGRPPGPAAWTAASSGQGLAPMACDTGIAFHPVRAEGACTDSSLLKVFKVPGRSSAAITFRSFVTAGQLFPADGFAALRCVSYGPDGERVVVLNGHGRVTLWDIERSERIPPPLDEMPPARAAAFGPDGRLLAVGGEDGSITLWDLEHGTLWATLSGHTGPVTSLAFAPDGRTLASGGQDRTIITWSLDETTAYERLERAYDGT